MTLNFPRQPEISRVVYTEHRVICARILAQKRYPDFSYKWHNTNHNWSQADQLKLEILCEADADPDASADALGRKPSALVWRARELNITLPRQWVNLIRPKRPIKLREPVASYPYIVKPRAEHIDLLAINAVIPDSIPDDMRADICQEIMVAILEGRTSINAIKSKSRSAQYFMRKFYRDNYEQGGHAIAFETVGEEFDDRRSYQAVYRNATQPNQIEATWLDQLGRYRLRASEAGQFLSHEEAVELLGGET